MGIISQTPPQPGIVFSIQKLNIFLKKNPTLISLFTAILRQLKEYLMNLNKMLSSHSQLVHELSIHK